MLPSLPLETKRMTSSLEGIATEQPLNERSIEHIYNDLKCSKFDLKKIASLEASQLLEKILWPQFPSCGGSASLTNDLDWTFLGVVVDAKFKNQGISVEEETGTQISSSPDLARLHQTKIWVFMLVCLLNEKFRQRIEAWNALGLEDVSKDQGNFQKFRLFFYLAWFIFLQPEKFNLSTKESASLLQFFIHVYQSLEQEPIRRVCMPLCGLPSWMQLGAKQLSHLLDLRPELTPLWKLIQKRYRALSKRCGANARFDSPKIELEDRFCLLDRDAFREALLQFIRMFENILPKKIDEKNLRHEIVHDCNGIFSTNDLHVGKEYNDVRLEKDQTMKGSTEDSQVEKVPTTDESTEFRNEHPDDLSTDDFLYCERFLEFLIDLLSQLPTRRIIRPVFSSHQVLSRIRLSPLYRHFEAALIRQLIDILSDFEFFEIDDTTGEPLDNKHLEGRHYNQLKQMQLLFFEHFQNIPVLKEAALAPISIYSSSTALSRLFSIQTVSLLLQIADALNFVDALEFARTALGHLLPINKGVSNTATEGGSNQEAIDIERYQGSEAYTLAHRLLVEVLVNHLHRRPSQLVSINRLPLYPTETLIWDPNFVPTEYYQGDFSLALPKLNLQFLTIRDYLLRNFHLFRLESAYEIREDLEEALYRMKPYLGYANNDSNRTIVSYEQQSLLETQFRGTWKMASPLVRFAIVLVKPPALGSDVPLEVRGEITIDLKRVPPGSRREWDSLRQFDVLFLLAIRAPQIVFEGRPRDLASVADFPEKFGVLGVRGCEIVEVLDEEGQSLSEPSGTGQAIREPFGSVRTYRVLLDPYQYKRDLDEVTSESKGGEETLDIYSALNLVVRRKAAENNFKAILQTIRCLMNDIEHAVIPSWLHDLFLGYGDPTSAQYFNLPTQLSRIDFADTFLEYDHIRESFPMATSITVNLDDQQESSGLDEQCVFSPCYITFKSRKLSSTRLSSLTSHHADELLTVEPYTHKSRGPYPQCEVKRNKIRFTPAQIEAIRSGTNPGLTLIVGPPGTGKTDTAVQIAHLLHKNFPEQRILLVAHSNQALNDLFEKIAALDIDERYLLRLGMGEKELHVASDKHLLNIEKKDFSKWGRVNYMLQRRLDFLKRVDFLGQSLRIIGDVGSSCETAVQFYRSQILSRIQRFRRLVESVGKGGKGLRVVLRDMRIQDGEQNKAVRTLLVSKKKFCAKKATKPRDGQPLKQKRQRAEEDVETEKNEGEDTVEEIENMEEKDLSDNKQTSTNEDMSYTDDENEEIQILRNFDEIDDAACAAVKQNLISVVEGLFPFTDFFADVPGELFPKIDGKPDYDNDLEIAEGCFLYLSEMFKEIEECRAFELLRTLHDRGEYLLTRHAKVIAMTCTHAALVRQQMVDIRLRYDTLIMEEAAQVLEVETFIPMVLQKTEAGGISRLKRVVLIGDHNQLPPVVKNRGFQQYGRLDQSMFTRLIRLQVPFVQLDKQGRCRSSLRTLFSWRYSHPPLQDLPIVSISPEYQRANVGLCYDYQFINVNEYEGRGEFCPSPHFYQNRGEAEYSVALFMYMRLLGYPASKIAILTTYNGQKALLKEVIQQRCGWNPAIGWPAVVSTVDKFQGQQSDYVILSLVRTRAVGHLRDIRRLVVAVSRARLGLYIFGRIAVFGSCPELNQTFQYFEKRPAQLALNLEEDSFESGTQRDVAVTGPVTLVDDVYGMWTRVQEKAMQELSQSQPAPS